jgi:hypothetical protein
MFRVVKVRRENGIFGVRAEGCPNAIDVKHPYMPVGAGIAQVSIACCECREVSSTLGGGLS